MSTTTPQQHFITLRRIKGSTQAQLDFTISSLEATLQHIRHLIPKLSKELAALEENSDAWTAKVNYRRKLANEGGAMVRELEMWREEKEKRGLMKK